MLHLAVYSSKGLWQEAVYAKSCTLLNTMHICIMICPCRKKPMLIQFLADMLKNQFLQSIVHLNKICSQYIITKWNQVYIPDLMLTYGALIYLTSMMQTTWANKVFMFQSLLCDYCIQENIHPCFIFAPLGLVREWIQNDF